MQGCGGLWSRHNMRYAHIRLRRIRPFMGFGPIESRNPLVGQIVAALHICSSGITCAARILAFTAICRTVGNCGYDITCAMRILVFAANCRSILCCGNLSRDNMPHSQAEKNILYFLLPIRQCSFSSSHGYCLPALLYWQFFRGRPPPYTCCKRRESLSPSRPFPVNGGGLGGRETVAIMETSIMDARWFG